MKNLWEIGFLIAILSFNLDKGASQVIINEVASSNFDFFRDEDGDYEDWIELVNSGTVTVNIAGYSLSNDRNNFKKWFFPGYELAGGEFLVVFASDKDRDVKPNYWKTIVKEGDIFQYILPGVSTPLAWKEPGFNDEGWLSGPTGIGYGDNDDATIIPKTLSVFLRRKFIIDDLTKVSACIFHMDYDDGFVAYLNGKEFARRSVTGNPPAYNTKASPDREALMYSGGSPERFDIPDPEEYLIQGENVLAIQVHNTSLTSTDLTAIPFLSILTPDLPEENPPAVLELVSTYFHLNFKLEKSGEPLFLTDPQSSYTDSVLLPSMSANHSYGRLLSDPERWGVFETPTPEGENIGPFLQGYVEDVPVFSKTGGRFPDGFQLTLSRAKPEDSIYYTLDGSDPAILSKLYKTPLTISDNEIVRARILKKGYVPGKIISNTYFKGADNNLPVICLSTDPSNLWDYNSGIYVKGPNAQNDFPYFDANFWEDWEKPVHIEFYENDGNHAFSLDAGMKIYGGWTRGHPQKSAAFFARSKYGPNRIEYQIFKDKPIMEFKSFIIRNSGNDWFGESSGEGTMFRDVLMTRLTKSMDLEILASRQAVVYINGEYWGIQNIREKISEHYLASNKAVDPDQVELLERNQAVIAGDNQHYAALINFINSNNIQIQANYDYVKNQMDIRNFINYQVAQIYYDNTDWPGNNIKYWRPATPNGKWRWIMYDTDFGFGLWNPNNVYNNTILFATSPNGPSHPNPPWSTFLLRQLLLNEDFKHAFINTFADHINTSFNADLVIDMINNLRDTIDEEMFHHVNRWGGSYQNWINQTNDLRNFARLRPANMLTYLRNTFGLGYKKNLNLDVSDQKGGYIKLNSIYLHSFPWQGTYFEGVPVEITAIPNPGYRFTGWSGDLASSSPDIIIDIKNMGSLTANFFSDAELEGYPVVINEISYKPDAYDNSEDWVELYNNSDYLTDISGWVLKDANDANFYFIKQGTVMPPHHYHVICRNLMSFETVYPMVKDYQGEMGFGLSNEGDIVRLFNHKMELVDSVAYGISLPWPEIQNGSGYTLALRDPSSDNALPLSWFLSNDRLGTPGGDNAFALGNEGHPESELTDVLFQNSPNPFTNYTKIIFYSAREQWIRIIIYDLNGRQLEIVSESLVNEGYHEFEWNPAHQGDGVYILRVETPGAVFTKKMVRTR